MPTYFPCGTFTVCPDPANPFENLSSESEDGPTFIGLDYGFGRLPPKLGSSWRVPSCLGVCESFESQVKALLCAARNELECVTTSGGVPPEDPLPNPNPDPDVPPPFPPDPPTNPPETPDTIFFNAQQIITAYCPDGLPFSSVVAAGEFSATSQALADQMAATFALQTVVLTRFCLPEITPLACLDAAYLSLITVQGAGAGGQDPFGFIILSGTLPFGIALTQTGPRTVALSGTPSNPGVHSFTLRATDNIGNYMDKVYQLTIVGIIDQSVPDYTTGTPYTHQFTAVLNTAPGTWSIAGGSLPTGLTLDADGLLSGTPTSSDPATFILSVTDAGGFTCQHTFTISPEAVACVLNVIFLPDDEVPLNIIRPTGFVSPDDITLYTSELGIIRTTTDGITYTGISTTSLGFVFLSYGQPSGAGAPMFAATGGTGDFGGSDCIGTSPDAITWTVRRFSTDVYRGVAFGSGRFVTVGDGGVSAFTVDGATWTTALTGTSDDFNGIAFSAGVFVCVGDNGNIYTTVDGIVWNAQTSGVATDLLGVAFNNGLFVAVGSAGVILTSPDGAVWTPRTGDPGNLKAVAAGCGFYVTIGDSDEAWVSTDGINWSFNRTGFTFVPEAYGGYFNNGTFVITRMSVS